jgi:hypothetical protein
MQIFTLINKGGQTMKLQAHQFKEIFWQIVGDHVGGKGLNFETYNMNKQDIKDFALFCMKFLKEETAQEIIQAILDKVYLYEEDKP